MRAPLGIVGLSLWLMLAIHVSLRANPSDKQPFAPLDLHGQQFAPELVDAAQKLAEKNRAAIEKFAALQAQGKLAKIDPLDLGATHVGVVQLGRAAQQLVTLGEPAGVDYRQRAGEQGQAVHRLVVALKAGPNAAQGIANLRTRANQRADVYRKQLPKLTKLVEQQKWEDAERELYEVYDNLYVYSVYLDSDDLMRLFSSYFPLEARINEGLLASRKATALQLLNERIAAAKPDFAKLLAEVQAATKGLGKTGKHTLDGKSLSGPEWIAHFDGAWQKVHVATLQTLALAGARVTLTDTTSPEAAQLRADYDKFADALGAELSALIITDGQRAGASASEALYAAYLPAVADLVDHTDGALYGTMQPALEKLASLSPELLANVQAYRAVTDDLLRWRERVAAEQAAAQSAAYPSIHTPAHNAFQHATDFTGLFPPQPVTNSEAKLGGGAAGTVLSIGSPKIVGQQALVQNIVALPGASQAGIAQYQQRVYARVTLPLMELAAAIAALESDLLISDKQPPLSLAAMRAVRGARRGDLVQAGGTVNGVFLEGHVTRFATLPDAAALLVPLGALPPEHQQRDQLEQVLLRFDLQPHWVQQRYLFVKLPK